jgi:hypothetical protein
MDLKETGSIGVEWIHPARYIFQQQPFVNNATLKKSSPRFFGYDIPLQLPLTYVNQHKAPIVNMGFDAIITANNRVYRMATEGNREKYATGRMNS